MGTNKKELFFAIAIFVYLMLPIPSLGEELISDPLEPLNRVIFEFNEGFDDAIYGPVARTYRDVMPDKFEIGIRNILSNLQTPKNVINSLLQAKIEQAVVFLGRFIVNTVFGLGGILDVAREIGMDQPLDEDFDTTLGFYGFGSGAYLVLPILGPSSIRNVLGRSVDFLLSPTYLVYHVGIDNGGVENTASYTYTGVLALQLRADSEDGLKAAREASLDFYSFQKRYFVKERRKMLNDGKTDLEDLFED